MSEHKLPAKFTKKIQGKDFVLFEGLLEMAHAEGLKRVETQLLQAPHKDNGMLAITRAVIETEKGVFSALGDASPDSAEQPMRPHLVRLSDTRAIARAIRIAVNVGMTALEEINVGEPIAGANGSIAGNGGRNKMSNNDSNNAYDDDESTKTDWLEKPESVVLSFGKHADKMLGDVLVEDPTYVEWLSKEAYDYVLRSAAKKLIDKSAPDLSGLDMTGTGEIML